MGETRIVIWATDHMVVISSSCLPAFLSILGMALQALQEPSNPASDEEAGGEDTDGVQGVDQQQGGGVEQGCYSDTR